MKNLLTLILLLPLLAFGQSANSGGSINAGAISPAVAGVTSIIAGAGISVDAATGAVTITSTGAGTGDMLLSGTQTNTGAKTFADGTLKLAGSTSGASTLKAPAIAGTTVYTLPPATDTLAGLGANNTFTGTNVFPSGQALIAPALGTPVSVVLTNATGTAANLTAGTATKAGYVSKVVTSTSHGLTVGTLYGMWNSTGTTWVKASASSTGFGKMTGIAQPIDVDTFTLIESGDLTTTGLTAGTQYYLTDDGTGLLTATAPTTTTSFVVPVLLSGSTTLGVVNIQAPAALAKIDLTADVTGVTPVANGGYATTFGRVTAQTAAASSIATVTVGGSDSTYEVSANILVTTATTHAFTCTCAYTDEGNTARVITFNFSNVGGTMLTSIANTGGAVPYEGVPLHIRCKASTTITIATAAGGTYTVVTYNADGRISKLQ